MPRTETREEFLKYLERCELVERFYQKPLDNFLREVYRNGLQEAIDAVSCRGMSGHFGRTAMRTYVLAGRLMITFERSVYGHQLTIMGREREVEPCFGIHTEQCSLLEGRAMLKQVCDLWLLQRDTFRCDIDVTIG